MKKSHWFCTFFFHKSNDCAQLSELQCSHHRGTLLAVTKRTCTFIGPVKFLSLAWVFLFQYFFICFLFSLFSFFFLSATSLFLSCHMHIFHKPKITKAACMKMISLSPVSQTCIWCVFYCDYCWTDWMGSVLEKKTLLYCALLYRKCMCLFSFYCLVRKIVTVLTKLDMACKSTLHTYIINNFHPWAIYRSVLWCLFICSASQLSCVTNPVIVDTTLTLLTKLFCTCHDYEHHWFIPTLIPCMTDGVK